MNSNPYSELAHMYAISSVIGEPIKSNYPPQSYSEYTSEPLTRRVIGRDVRNNAMTPEVWVMGTMCPYNDRFLPNHFVPLTSVNNVQRFSSVTMTRVPNLNLKATYPVMSVNCEPVSANSSFGDVACEEGVPSDTHLSDESVDVDVV